MVKQSEHSKCHCLNCALWERSPIDNYVGWCQWARNWCFQLEQCDHYLRGEERKLCRSESGNHTNHKAKDVKVPVEKLKS
jgi:hypothetical protein